VRFINKKLLTVFGRNSPVFGPTDIGEITTTDFEIRLRNVRGNRGGFRKIECDAIELIDSRGRIGKGRSGACVNVLRKMGLRWSGRRWTAVRVEEKESEHCGSEKAGGVAQ
jgi:hypothetical protein